MLVYVTGASGHVGGAIARGLLDAGHEVVGLSRRLSAPGGARSVAVDLAERDALAALPPASAIVHAAACLSKDPLDPSVLAVNALGTLEVARFATTHAAKVVYVSGVPVIGAPATWPITEEHPTAPSTSYHASKLFGEHLLGAACPGSVTSLRVTSPIGPGMPDGRILSHFVAQALAGAPLVLAGEGSRRQDYVDVRDVAAAAVAAVRAEGAGTLNIGAGRSVSNLELAEACVDVLGSTSEVAFSGAADPEEGVRWEVSIDRARAALGYESVVPLASSIEAVADERRELRDG